MADRESELPIGRCADGDGVPKEQERGLTGARTADRSKFLASIPLVPLYWVRSKRSLAWVGALARLSSWLPPPFSRSAWHDFPLTSLTLSDSRSLASRRISTRSCNSGHTRLKHADDEVRAPPSPVRALFPRD